MVSTPFRMAAVLAGFAAILWGAMAVLQWGFESRHWSPPYVAMISMTISSSSLGFYALFLARKRRRNRNTHA